jgi:predicted Zn-dependent protease with MMP-like domain
MMPRAAFEELVAEALDNLPEYFQQAMSNVELLVESWPTPAHLRDSHTPPGYTLLGLYQGIPLTERYNYNLVVPDTITLFQRPIEQSCATADDVAQAIRTAVRHTVIHELAHHFGIDDDRLRELGAY